jgi:uncharacterized membrane protein
MNAATVTRSIVFSFVCAYSTLSEVTMRNRFNWPLWSGLALSAAAFVSYFLVFSAYPITRDFPWATLLLFAIALILLFIGVRRAFAAEPRSKARRVIASIVTFLGAAIFVFFCFAVFVATKMIPKSAQAIAVGARAPEFTLPDINNRSVALSELIGAPGTKGVVLIFYRGFW